MNVDLAKENPYVAVASKKHRNLKKKMEKIAKIEQQLAAGKPLDQEQTVLLNSKRSVEKALQDVATLKAQLEEVAKLQLEEQQGKSGSSQPAADEEREVVETSEEQQADYETANVETNTDAQYQLNVEQYAVSTMTEPDAEVSRQHEVDHRLDLEEKVNKLVKALHVYQRYKEVTGRNLPDNVDFFGRTLLGLTTISGFSDTLQHSTRVTGYYLNDDLAAVNEVVRGCNYLQMAEMIDSLSEEMERVPPNRTGSGTLTALLRNSISTPAAPPSEPTINARPVPHIPPATEVPIPVVAEISPTKYDLPAPQPVPQFVTLEPNFGTLQFGAVTNSLSTPPTNASPAPASLSYATINFQPEPFFQLAPPAVSQTVEHVRLETTSMHVNPTISAPAPPLSSQPLEHSRVVPETTPTSLTTHEEPELAQHHIRGTESTDTANTADDQLLAAAALGETGKSSEEEGEATGDANNANRRVRNRNNRRRNNKEGATGSTPENVEGAVPSDKPVRKRNNDRPRYKKDRDSDGNDENPREEGGNKGYVKKRSFNRDQAPGAEGKETKEYNWTKKASNKAKPVDGPVVDNATHKSEEKSEPVAESAAPVTVSEATSKPVTTITPTETKPEAAAPVKRSSYLDAVKPGASAEAAKTSEEQKPARKPFSRDHKDGTGERRDRSNNRVPRDREGGDRPAGQREFRDRGHQQTDNNGQPRRPVYRNNNNNNSNNNHSNTNNSQSNSHQKDSNARTVNHAQTVRRPAPASKSENA